MALDLPKGHWMHAVLAKEQGRLAKGKPANPKDGVAAKAKKSAPKAPNPTSAGQPSQTTPAGISNAPDSMGGDSGQWGAGGAGMSGQSC